MRYVVEVGGERIVVDLDGDVATVDGAEVRATIAEVEGTPVRLVTIGDEMHRVLARRSGTRGRYTMSLDGYRFEGTSTTPVEGGGEVHTRSIQVYDGRTGFFINCQYAPDTQEEILDGCQQIADSFSTE